MATTRLPVGDAFLLQFLGGVAIWFEPSRPLTVPFTLKVLFLPEDLFSIRQVMFPTTFRLSFTVVLLDRKRSVGAINLAGSFGLATEIAALFGKLSVLVPEGPFAIEFPFDVRSFAELGAIFVKLLVRTVED